ncbi:NUDIX hydrolase [Cesiribacter andamanensis]|uniref:Putative NUDIX hydrolase n=1 Tax=Cesiribacter andamanensis AMV16 TaxID=1279009 RepID=M7N8X4_9BACT|nr:CoA pyrophosphatase [Cesiribacter andamanensis]EMR03661.1 putative NUDIX hydrolase [Cesiribacter andamanensis AMV16]
MEQFIDALRKRLQEPLPGIQAQARMTPELDRDVRFKIKARPDARRGSVLLLLYPQGGSFWFPLMQRPTYEGHHSGQVSLPGGKSEPGDPDRIYTALRETQEEMGIPMEQVQVLGTLSELYIPPSNFVVLPVIGYLPVQPLFVPDPLEVEQVLEVPLKDLLEENLIKFTDAPPGARFRIQTPYYPLQERVVWGATAMMLSEFIMVVEEVQQQLPLP